ncbi:MotA/TolQ/ExbB proton channel family protein [uncultured Sulfuricurvum sp.]|uniref:MotA/TolQ/ExbB proton channel family protein n=1 Tax=uncultured Sulfuricurvum sp. TaxID=430693 RepID=UPI0026398270|nr:MotA/TolQ/ExbB proton channel family protein [uncultured Sulfuricurvum sp.]
MSFNLELFMYYVGQLFLVPTLVLISLLFVYSFFALGQFMMLSYRRQSGRARPLVVYAGENPNATDDELDLYAHKLLEFPRIASRVTPMLGLVATMIPMGPALKSLSDGNFADVSNNLSIAFSAVILALIAASITYYIANIRRRWLAEELIEITQKRGI